MQETIELNNLFKLFGPANKYAFPTERLRGPKEVRTEGVDPWQLVKDLQVMYSL